MSPDATSPGHLPPPPSGEASAAPSPESSGSPSGEVPGDVDAGTFRAAAHRVADIVADYLEGVGRYPVAPPVEPGDVRRRLPEGPPAQGEPLDRILDEYCRLIEPNVTHWNHPGFFAYFAITGSGPGILGETLAAALNVNAMLWRTGPAPTELEELVCDWLRQMLGLPAEFRGHINDTASMGTLLALAAARQAVGDPHVLERGLAGRPEVPPLVVYGSEHAHSSLDKAAIALGIGLAQVRRVTADASYRIDPSALAGAIAADRAAGRRPFAVVATAGTTSTTSVDPLRVVAAVCREERLWLHVDAAYAGVAAICPEYRQVLDGLELADSLVVNPHKWLFTPVDCSVLWLRDPAALRAAFAVVPEYLKTGRPGGTNLMDYGVQLGRRFRALKLWMVIRAFGVEGLRDRIRHHCALAREFAAWVAADPGFELVAPTPFSTVCFRAVPDLPEETRNYFNQRLLGAVNGAGPVWLSHTVLGGRYVLRLAIGNLRTGRSHVAQAWELILDAAGRLVRGAGG